MPEDKDKAAADKAASEKAAADRDAAEKAAVGKAAAATEAATSVAEAVKRVADAAVAEVNKVKPVESGDFVFSGSPGGRFRIDGSGFGTNGTLTVGGVQVHATGWGSTHIEGTLPADVKSGEVVVHIDDKTTKRAHVRF